MTENSETHPSTASGTPSVSYGELFSAAQEEPFDANPPVAVERALVEIQPIRIEATPVRPDDGVLNIDSEGSRIPFWCGGSEGEKYALEATVDGRIISLVERPHDDRYVEKWQAFREAGMPVVPVLWTTEIEGEPKLLSPDLKADGSELYGKGLLAVFTDEDDEPRERVPSPEVDKLFLHLADPNAISLINDEANAIADLATQNGLRLPFDDPLELQVHPDGTWELVILDLRFSHVYATGRTQEDHARLQWDNANAVNKFLGSIKDLREVMAARYSTEEGR